MKNMSSKHGGAWSPPVFSDDSAAVKEREVKLPTPEDIQKIYDEARRKGRSEGYSDGYRDGMETAKSSVDEFSRNMSCLASPLKNIEEKIAHDMARLAVGIAKSVIRREVSMNPEVIISLANESISILPVKTASVSVHMNPEDCKILMSHLDTSVIDYKIIEDASISRGGCRVVTKDSVVDCSLETRIEQVLDGVLGGAGE